MARDCPPLPEDAALDGDLPEPDRSVLIFERIRCFVSSVRLLPFELLDPPPQPQPFLPFAMSFSILMGQVSDRFPGLSVTLS